MVSLVDEVYRLDNMPDDKAKKQKKYGKQRSVRFALQGRAEAYDVMSNEDCNLNDCNSVVAQLSEFHSKPI